jgi:hypothetical protein
MLTLMKNPDHWRARARETRDLADEIADPDQRQLMLDIAIGYDRIAERAEERKASAKG